MSATLNKALLIGYAGKDPEIRTTKLGKKIVSVTLATKESRKDKETETQWHNLVFFNKLADIAEKYIKKGTHCLIEGNINYNKWINKEGIQQLKTQILVSNLQLLSTKVPSAEPVAENSGNVAPITAPFDDDIPW